MERLGDAFESATRALELDSYSQVLALAREELAMATHTTPSG